MHKLVVRAAHRYFLESILAKSADDITAVAEHVSPRTRLSDLSMTAERGSRKPHILSTKLSTTRFSPALSNAIVSLLPSTATTLPLPNFW